MKKKWRACVFSVMALGGVIIAGPVLAAPQEEAQQIIIQKEDSEQAGTNSEKARLTINAAANACGKFENKVAVSSDTFDYDKSNNQDGTSVFVSENTTEKIENPPADGSSIKYTLVKQISKTKK